MLFFFDTVDTTVFYGDNDMILEMVANWSGLRTCYEMALPMLVVNID